MYLGRKEGEPKLQVAIFYELKHSNMAEMKVYGIVHCIHFSKIIHLAQVSFLDAQID